jgi:glutathione S-transferase
MLLCYTALSPFCRKVRMVMDWKGIACNLVDSCDIAKYPAYNPRAEIPILIDNDVTVVNSADILGYLDRKDPALEIYPVTPADYALARQWEREADTFIDAIVTDVAIYKWADIPAAPEGLLDAARADLGEVYDRMEAALISSSYLTGTLSIADFAMYPHISAAQMLRIGTNADRHPRVSSWLKRMADTDACQKDTAARMQWWANRDQQGLDVQRIHWGTHRLEWFLANGFLDRFIEEVRNDRVLWSVGPNSNAKHSPLHPSRSRSTV